MALNCVNTVLIAFLCRAILTSCNESAVTEYAALDSGSSFSDETVFLQTAIKHRENPSTQEGDYVLPSDWDIDSFYGIKNRSEQMPEFPAMTAYSADVSGDVNSTWQCICGGWSGDEVQGTVWEHVACGVFPEVQSLPSYVNASPGRHRSVCGFINETQLYTNPIARNCAYEIDSVPKVTVSIAVAEGEDAGASKIRWLDHTLVENSSLVATYQEGRVEFYQELAALANDCVSKK
mmetsp:Transcript_46547/g.81980  ORF Transcript_46547/g.81980 Transcript_46547/m.81980 type:complete len:235 (+) Transcript_46547:79-783(+)